MKKVIDGALYNTETAKLVGSWTNHQRGFGYIKETLYRTKSGKYFVHGEGGANTRYSKSAGDNSWSGGENIEPMNPQAARKWAEEHLDADKYAAEFGEPEEAGDDKVALNLTVPANIKSKLEKMRSESGKSISQIISEMFA